MSEEATEPPAEIGDDFKRSAGTRAVVRNILRGVVRRMDQHQVLEGIIENVAERFDGWANVLTGLGNKLVDRTASMAPTVFRRLGDNALTTLFHGDPTARKGCEMRPKETLANGISFTLPKDKGGAELSTWVLDEHERLDSINKVVLAATWENLYGGAAIWVAVDDGHYDAFSQVRPVDMTKIERVLFIKELDRRQLWADYSAESIDSDPMSPTFGQPLLYLVDSGMGYQARVHRSRLILFPGAATTFELRQSYAGWGVSLLDIAWIALQRNAMVWGSSANAVGNAQYVVYKLKGLAHMLLAKDGEEKTKARAQAMEMAKSMINAVLIDGEDSYERENPDFGNLPEMLDRFMCEVANAFDIPVTKFFGRSPAGMNATGESDAENWNASKKQYWKHHLRLRFHRLSEFIIAQQSGKFGGVDPGGWSVSIPPFKELSELEKADVRLKTSQADAADIASGVITPIEVATSRFRPEGYSTETTIDIASREEMAALDKQRQEAEMTAAIELAKANAENPLGAPKPGDEGSTGDTGNKPAAKKES
jgi:phage-related protein (TIGR01555 family)